MNQYTQTLVFNESMQSLTHIDLGNVTIRNCNNIQSLCFNFYNLATFVLPNFSDGLQYASQAFDSCSNLQSIDITHCDFSKVENFNSFFAGCFNLTSIAGEFNTSSGIYFNQMFYNCSNLTYDASYFDTTKAQYNDEFRFNAPNVTAPKWKNIPTEFIVYDNTDNSLHLFSAFDMPEIGTIYEGVNVSNITEGFSPDSTILPEASSANSLYLEFNTTKVPNVYTLWSLQLLDCTKATTSIINTPNSFNSSIQTIKFNNVTIEAPNAFEWCSQLNDLQFKHMTLKFDMFENGQYKAYNMFNGCSSLNLDLNSSRVSFVVPSIVGGGLQPYLAQFKGMLGSSYSITPPNIQLSYIDPTTAGGGMMPGMPGMDGMMSTTEYITTVYYGYIVGEILHIGVGAYFGTSMSGMISLYGQTTLNSSNFANFYQSYVQEIETVSVTAWIYSSISELIANIDMSNITNITFDGGIKLEDVFPEITGTEIAEFDQNLINTLASKAISSGTYVTTLDMNNLKGILTTGKCPLLIYDMNARTNIQQINWGTDLQCTNYHQLFKDYTSLNMLNIQINSNTLVEDISEMFSGCTSLYYGIMFNYAEEVCYQDYNKDAPGVVAQTSLPAESIHYYMIYSEDDSSLTFYKRLEIPEVGSSYNSKTVTQIIDGYPLEFPIDFDVSTIPVTKLRAADKVTLYQLGTPWSVFGSLEELDFTNVNLPKYSSCANLFTDSQVSIIKIPTLNTTDVTNFSSMFQGCTNLTILEVTLDTKCAQAVDYMFADCPNLEYDASYLEFNTIPSSTGFNQNSPGVTAPEVKTMFHLITNDGENYNYYYRNLPLGYVFNAGETYDNETVVMSQLITESNMFLDPSSMAYSYSDLKNFIVKDDWDVPETTTMLPTMFQYMFSNIEVIDFSKTSGIISNIGMFNNKPTLTTFKLGATLKCNSYSYTFQGDTNLATLELNLDPNVEIYVCDYTFQNCEKLIYDASNWNVSSSCTGTGFNENAPGVIPPAFTTPPLIT